jgi:hypothetical protein
MTPKLENNEEDRRLREAGYDPSAEATKAVALLRALRGQPGISDSAIARALGKLNSVEAAAMLADMEPGGTGMVRREIRRALFRLKQAGIAPPAPERVPSSSNLSVLAQSTGIEAVLSRFDSAGVRMGWIVKERPRGGLARLWCFLSENEGLIGCQMTLVTRRELRQDRARLEVQLGDHLIDADWRLVDRIMLEAWRRTPEEKRAAVGTYLALRSELLGSLPDEDFEHPIYNELAHELSGEPSAQLAQEPELASWPVPGDELKPFIEQIMEIQNSVIVLSPAHNEERINAVIENATRHLFGGNRTDSTRRRLEDAAYYMARTGRRTAAGWAAGAAKRIRDGIDPAKIAPLRELARAMIAAELASKTQKQREEPRLVMTPAEAMRSQARRSGNRL